MTRSAAAWRFTAEYPVEADPIVGAREAAAEWGIEPVSVEAGAHLAVLAAAIDARSIVEVGTGTGVSGLWLLQGATEATLTTIEVEVDHQQVAKRAFAQAGLGNGRTRSILGRASTVLERLADAAYDLVFVDADVDSAPEYVAHALRLSRPGGLIVLAHALDHGRVADPANRRPEVAALRDLLAEIGQRPHVRSSLLAEGDGLLTLVAPRS